MLIIAHVAPLASASASEEVAALPAGKPPHTPTLSGLPIATYSRSSGLTPMYRLFRMSWRGRPSNRTAGLL
jgi:hypothetical protein